MATTPTVVSPGADNDALAKLDPAQELTDAELVAIYTSSAIPLERYQKAPTIFTKHGEFRKKWRSLKPIDPNAPPPADPQQASKVPNATPAFSQRDPASNFDIDDHALDEEPTSQNMLRWISAKEKLGDIVRRDPTPIPTKLKTVWEAFKPTRTLHSTVSNNGSTVSIRVGEHKEDLLVSDNVWRGFKTGKNKSKGRVNEFPIINPTTNKTPFRDDTKPFDDQDLRAISETVKDICQRGPIEVDGHERQGRILIVQAAALYAAIHRTTSLRLTPSNITNVRPSDPQDRLNVEGIVYYFNATTFVPESFRVSLRLSSEYKLERVKIPELGFRLPPFESRLRQPPDDAGISQDEQKMGALMNDYIRYMVLGKVATKQEVALYVTFLRCAFVELRTHERAGVYAGSLIYKIKPQNNFLHIMPSDQVAKDVAPSQLPDIYCSSLTVVRVTGAIVNVWLLTAQIERAWEAGVRQADLAQHIENTDPADLDYASNPQSEEELSRQTTNCASCQEPELVRLLRRYGSQRICQVCADRLTRIQRESWKNPFLDRLRDAMMSDNVQLSETEVIDTFKELAALYRKEENGAQGWFDPLSQSFRPDPDPSKPYEESDYNIGWDAIWPIILYLNALRIHALPNLIPLPLYINRLKHIHPPAAVRAIVDLIEAPTAVQQVMMMRVHHLYLIRLQFPYPRAARLALDCTQQQIEDFQKQNLHGIADPEACKIIDPDSAWIVRGRPNETTAASLPTPGLELVEKITLQMEKHFGKKFPRYGPDNAIYLLDGSVKPKQWSWGHFYLMMYECLKTMQYLCNSYWVTTCTVQTLILVFCISYMSDDEFMRKYWCTPITPWERHICRLAIGKLVHKLAMDSGFPDGFKDFADWVRNNCNLSFEPCWVNYMKSDSEWNFDDMLASLKLLPKDNPPYWTIFKPFTPLPDVGNGKVVVLNPDAAALSSLAEIARQAALDRENQTNPFIPPRHPGGPRNNEGLAIGRNWTNARGTCYISAPFELLQEVLPIRGIFDNDWKTLLPLKVNTGRALTVLRSGNDINLKKHRDLMDTIAVAIRQTTLSEKEPLAAGFANAIRDAFSEIHPSVRFGTALKYEHC